MTKLLLLLSLLLIVSCEVAEEKDSGNLGKEIRFEPIAVTVNDNERIRAVCQALSSKEDLLNILVNTGTEYTFMYSQKNCNDKEAPAPKPVSTLIAEENGQFVFKALHGQSFGFKAVETESKGVMAEICKNIGALTSPMQTSSTGAIWFTTYGNSSHCTTDANGICVHLQRGVVQDSGNYIIHTNEWIKIKTLNEKRGFFTERTLISSAGCSGDKTLERRATLK